MKYIAQLSFADLRALQDELRDQIKRTDMLKGLMPRAISEFEDVQDKYRELHILAGKEIEKRIDILIRKHVEQ